ncbi:MAG: TetR/AcrR family transcriptional regulator [Leucobacter sp.]|nr:TetR/AcrR family transcriptional regulator [Leucobacter sp.]
MSQSTRERILVACVARISEDGVRRVRISDVAKEAGVSVGLVYYHFTDRAGLITETLEFVHELSRDRLVLPAKVGAEDPILAALLTDIEDREEVRANSVVWNEIRAIAVFEDELRASLRQATDHWQNDIAHDLADTSLHVDEHQAALMLTALIEGLSGRWLTGQITEGEAHAVIAEAWNLLRREPATTPPAHPHPTTEE